MMIELVGSGYTSGEIEHRLPLQVKLLRQVLRDDPVPCWLGELDNPLVSHENGIEKTITHVMLAERWRDTHIGAEVKDVPVNIYYVTDCKFSADQPISLQQCKYIGIGSASAM